MRTALLVCGLVLLLSEGGFRGFTVSRGWE